ncbi:hypothetical protein [Streptomyces canus]|uniref:hypothetical protein n=1 Tax=Streptomyces canus TaxID=58343 RepID=UPI0030DE44FC
MDASLAALLVGIAGVGGALSSGYLAQRAAREVRRWEGERQHRDNLRDCYIGVNSRARNCRYALADYLQAMNTDALTDEIRQSAAAAVNAHRIQYDEAQMLVSDSVLEEARIVNEKISVLYGLLRRLDGGVTQPDDSREQARRLLKDLWPALKAMRQTMRVDLGVSRTHQTTGR